MPTKLIILMMALSMMACSRYYPIAMENLNYQDRIENYAKISSEELSHKQYLIYNRDTINIFKSKTKTLGYRNIRTKEIYVFQFMDTDYYTTIKCDSLWEVQTVSQYMGEVY